MFAEHGFWGVSLDDIAERAHLTKGAIYSNFDSKEDLLIEVAARLSVSVDISILQDPSVPARRDGACIGKGDREDLDVGTDACARAP